MGARHAPYATTHMISHRSSSSRRGAASSPPPSTQNMSMPRGSVRLFSHAFMEFLTKASSCTCRENCLAKQRTKIRSTSEGCELGEDSHPSSLRLDVCRLHYKVRCLYIYSNCIHRSSVPAYRGDYNTQIEPHHLRLEVQLLVNSQIPAAQAWADAHQWSQGVALLALAVVSPCC